MGFLQKRINLYLSIANLSWITESNLFEGYESHDANLKMDIIQKLELTI